MTDSNARTGNSISGPITNTREIRGWRGNVITAIANEIGEFLADVVKTNDTISGKGNRSNLPVKTDRHRAVAKNRNNGGSIRKNTIRFDNNTEPCDANIEMMARHSKEN